MGKIDLQRLTDTTQLTAADLNRIFDNIALALGALDESNFAEDATFNPDQVPHALSIFGGEVTGNITTADGVKIGVDLAELDTVVSNLSNNTLEYNVQTYDFTITIKSGTNNYTIVGGDDNVINENTIIITPPEGFSGIDSYTFFSQTGFSNDAGAGLNSEDFFYYNGDDKSADRIILNIVTNGNEEMSDDDVGYSYKFTTSTIFFKRGTGL